MTPPKTTRVFGKRIIDLSLTVEDGTKGPPSTKAQVEITPARRGPGHWQASSFKGALHTGSHVDSPRHVVAEAPLMAEIPLDRVIGDAKVFKKARHGDLVVVVLMDEWFSGSGGMGDGGWGGGHMGGSGKADGVGDGESTIVALDLATGAERWRVTVPGDMASMVEFSPDGAQLYVSARDMGNGFGMGQGSIRQGEAAGAGFMFSSTIVAFDRSGNQLWTYELGSQ